MESTRVVGVDAAFGRATEVRPWDTSFSVLLLRLPALAIVACESLSVLPDGSVLSGRADSTKAGLAAGTAETRSCCVRCTGASSLSSSPPRGLCRVRGAEDTLSPWGCTLSADGAGKPSPSSGDREDSAGSDGQALAPLADAPEAGRSMGGAAGASVTIWGISGASKSVSASPWANMATPEVPGSE